MNSNSSFFSLRHIIDYIRATENEIAIDIAAYGLCGIDPSNAGYVPRPTKWVRKVGKSLFLIKLLGLSLGIIWRFGGSQIFYFAEFCRFYFYSKFCRDPLPETLTMNSYVLSFSSRAADIIRHPTIDNITSCYITVPWAPIAELPSSSTSVDVFSLLSGSDLVRAYFFSVLATKALSTRKEVSKWILQSYTAFRWFAVRAAIEKLGGHFFIAEHYDRWAILADSAVSRRKRGASSESGMTPELHLFQHGSLGSLNLREPARRHRFELKRRLNAVTHLYVYDEVSMNFFMDRILSVKCISLGVKLTYFSHKISLQHGLDSANFRILFVGHPLCEDFHIYLHGVLSQKFNIYFYYKPHPTASICGLAKNIEWNVIEDRNFFPNVDMLISYPSTLVNEYASHGIHALVHPMNMKKENSDNFTEEIISNINSMIFNLIEY